MTSQYSITFVIFTSLLVLCDLVGVTAGQQTSPSLVDTSTSTLQPPAALTPAATSPLLLITTTTQHSVAEPKTSPRLPVDISTTRLIIAAESPQVAVNVSATSQRVAAAASTQRAAGPAISPQLVTSTTTQAAAAGGDGTSGQLAATSPQAPVGPSDSARLQSTATVGQQPIIPVSGAGNDVSTTPYNTALITKQQAAVPTSPGNQPNPSPTIPSTVQPLVVPSGSVTLPTVNTRIPSSISVSTLKPSPTLPSNTPLPSALTSPVYRLTTTGPSTPPRVGLDIWDCQLLFNNDYDSTLNISGRTSEDYASQLGSVIARKVGIGSVRVTDVQVFKHPATGSLVLKFSVRPPVSGICYGDCLITTPLVIEMIQNQTNALKFYLTDTTLPTPQVLNITSLPAFFAWTDNGPCPNESCSSNYVCQCRLTGDFYCQCLSNCPSSVVVEKEQSNQKLWALIVIPIVLIIVLIIVFVILIRLRLIKLPIKKQLKTVRNYRPAYDIGTIVNQPMIATLDPGATNRLYRTLGSTLGVAIHDKTFQQDGSDGSTSSDSGLAAPFGTP